MLKKKLSNLRMKENESIQEYIDKITTLMEELEAIDSSLSEEDKVANLLNGLTQNYDNVIVSLETRLDQVNIEFVMAR